MSRKSIILSAALGLALAGCGPHTLSEMRERTPAVVANSTKSASVIGPCFVDATDKLGVPSYVPREHGASLEVQIQGGYAGKNVMIGAEIEDQGAQRHVTIWTIKPVFRSRIRHAIERMQACL